MAHPHGAWGGGTWDASRGAARTGAGRQPPSRERDQLAGTRELRLREARRAQHAHSTSVRRRDRALTVTPSESDMRISRGHTRVGCGLPSHARAIR